MDESCGDGTPRTPAGDPPVGEDEAPPVFGAWGRVYAVVLVFLVLNVAGLLWLTSLFPGAPK